MIVKRPSTLLSTLFPPPSSTAIAAPTSPRLAVRILRPVSLTIAILLPGFDSQQPLSASPVRRVLPACLRTDPPLAHLVRTRPSTLDNRPQTPNARRTLQAPPRLVDAGAPHRQSCIVVSRVYSPGFPARPRVRSRPLVLPSDPIRCSKSTITKASAI